jgi:hypothetical protein
LDIFVESHLIQSTVASDCFRRIRLKASKFVRNGNFKRRNTTKKLCRIAAISIVLLAVLIGCGISQPMQVAPELPGSAQNNGTDRAIISWDYPYEYTVMSYDLIIARSGEKDTVVRSYNVSDTSPGQKSPLKSSYEWNVPKDAREGRYRAELQIKTVEAGGAVHDTISRAFEVARDLGNLRIFKYNDSNGNGAYDQGEKGLSGWQFTITTTANEKYTKNTDANGIIELKNLPVGSYIVNEVERAGYKPTTETQQSIWVTKDETKDVVFGNQPLPARILIIKYEDKNRNKVQDSNETGVSGWEFSIQGPNALKAVTDSNGSISREVEPGNYRIAEVIKSTEDWQATTPTEQSIVLERGKEGILRFGNFRIARSMLTIIKFEDLNGNGVYDQNQGEEGLSGWEFSVEGQEPLTTGEEGIISLRDIKSGTYIVREKAKPGWFSTTKTEQSIKINPGEEKKLYFGNKQPQLITKFEDKNANGAMDSGEPGLAGWTFEIKGPVTITKTTDANGQININDLPAGDYVVAERLIDASWYNTTPITQSIKVPGSGAYFGNDKYRTLSVLKFNDLNKDGKYNGNEAGLEGWEFQVSNQAGQAFTDSKGLATFNVRANEKYLVSESLPVNWLNSTPLEIMVQIDPSKDVTEVSFGDYSISPLQDTKRSAIRIHAYNDTNRNGVLDPGEPGLSNREMHISNLGDPSGPSDSITTDSKGDLEYPSAAGTYKAEQILLSNWCTNGEIASKVSLGANENRTVNFGSYPCVSGNCEYRYKPSPGNLTLSAEDENLVVKKSVDPYVLSLTDHDMMKGALINYTITVCAKPKIGPTDMILAVDTSGSVIEGDKTALSNINRGISGFVEAMKKSQSSDLRIGLVSWDSNIDDTVEPTLNYQEVLNASGMLRANNQELTMYHVGMNGTLAAFDASPREGARKVIVFITDARNEYEPFLKYPDPSKYTIYVLLLNKPQVNETYEMLSSTANRFNGKLIQVDDYSEITSALLSLSKTSLIANGSVSDIKIDDTLPSYLRPLNKGTKPGVLHVNEDGVNWRTNSLTWSIPSLQYGRCWSTTFKAIFCWKLQANVAEPENSPRALSQVDYDDPATANRKIIALPEGTIWIESDEKATGSPQSESDKTDSKQEPGFEAFFAAIGISLAGYLYRRRMH